MRATAILWAAAGRPDPRRKTVPATGACYWCSIPITGDDARACKVDDVITDTFTDQDQALMRSSPWLCPGCAWTMTGRPPDTLRLWSVLWRDDGWQRPDNHPAAKDLGPAIHLQNKADPSAFRAVLRDPPAGRWLCSIADSGQIHTVPFAEVNHGAGRYSVRFERTTVWTTPEVYRLIDDTVSELVAAGFSKDDIAAGTPSPYRLTAETIPIWRSAMSRLAAYRGGHLLNLALFLFRKEKKTDEPARTREHDAAIEGRPAAAPADLGRLHPPGDRADAGAADLDAPDQHQADGLAHPDHRRAPSRGRQQSLF